MIASVILMILLLLLNMGLLINIENINSYDLPTLMLANKIDPILGYCLSIIMLLIIFNTVLGLMYAFASRFTEPHTKKYNLFICLMIIAAFPLSFTDFSQTVNFFFPKMGVVGIIILISFIIPRHYKNGQ